MAEQRFVARQGQLAELHGFLDQVLEAQGRVAFVVGEAGSGKTALVTEFVRQAEVAHDKLVVVAGNCNAQTGIGDPYLPFREVLAQLTGIAAGKPSQAAFTTENLRRLRGLVRWSCDALIDLGPDLINILVPGTALIAKAGRFVYKQAGCPERFKQFLERKASDPERATIDQSHIFEQYTNVLKALAKKRPLVVVLDDLQWADSASTSLLFHLGRRIDESCILVLGAFRPEEVKLGRAGERHPLEKVLSEFKRYLGDVWVDLDQAEVDEARLFVDALVDLEANNLGEEFRQALANHTGGHPLFAVELLRSMQEQGDLRKGEDGYWVEGSRLDWNALPPRVEGVIEEHIGRLEAELHETLKVGSVEGEQFTAEVVARVRGVEERVLVHRLGSQLDQQHHMVVPLGIRRLGTQPLSTYRFRHSLFQKYVYDNLDAAQKSYLHEDIGMALEVLYGEHMAEVAPQLGRHFSEAGLTDKAVYYLDLAGEQARRRYANVEATEYFRHALAMLANAPPSTSQQKQTAELYEKLGDMLFLTGRVEEAKTAYQENLTWVPKNDPIWQSRLQRKIGKTWERLRYYHKEALQAYDLAETILGAQPSEPGGAWWQEWIAIRIDRIWVIFWSRGEWREMHDLAEKMRPAVHQYGTPAQRSSFYECLVLVENRRYHYLIPEETVAYAITSFEASQESGDLGQVSRSQFLLGFCYLWRSDLEKAKETVQSALTLAERIGEVDVRLMCLAFLPVIYRKLRQVQEMRAMLPRSLAEAKERGSLEYEGMARANLAWVALQEGNLDEVQVNSQAALELWRPPVKLPIMWLAYWPLISVQLARGQLAEAVGSLRAMLAPDLQPLPSALTLMAEKAIAAWEADDVGLTVEVIGQAIALAQELGYL